MSLSSVKFGGSGVPDRGREDVRGGQAEEHVGAAQRPARSPAYPSRLVCSEYETLGAMVTWIPALLPAGAVGIQAYGAQRVG